MKSKSKIDKKIFLKIVIFGMLLFMAYFLISKSNTNNIKNNPMAPSVKPSYIKFCNENDNFINISQLPFKFSEEFVEIYGHELKCNIFNKGVYFTSITDKPVSVAISNDSSIDPGHGGPKYFGSISDDMGIVINDSKDMTVEFWGGWGDGGPMVAQGDSYLYITKELKTSEGKFAIRVSGIILPDYYKEYTTFLDSFNKTNEFGNPVLREGITRDDVDKAVMEKFLRGDLSEKDAYISSNYIWMLKILNSISPSN